MRILSVILLSYYNSLHFSGSEGKLIEKNGKSNATEASDGIVLDMVVNPSPGVASGQNKQLKVAIES